MNRVSAPSIRSVGAKVLLRTLFGKRLLTPALHSLQMENRGNPTRMLQCSGLFA
jgi:hypothetical protein